MQNDRRYTIRQEYCGHVTPQWVARFCGDWIGSHETREGAEDLAKAFDAPTIHVAHAVSRRNGVSYRARACVVWRGIPNDQTVSIDDTAADATANAVEYLRGLYRRDGLTPPAVVVDHGRMAAAAVDGMLFHRPIRKAAA